MPFPAERAVRGGDTGEHVIRKGWRMQEERAVPGVTDYYVHDEEGCPLWRMSTTSLCAWLMPVVEFAKLSLGDDVTPVLVFDRGGAFPENGGAPRGRRGFVTYERKRYPEIGATEFTESLTITLASDPRRPLGSRTPRRRRRTCVRAGRGRLRRIAMLTEERQQVNLLAVPELPAEALIRGHLARRGLQENQLVILAKRMDRPREAKKFLATLFAAPGIIHVASRALTVRLMPAASDSERVAVRAFLADMAGRRLSLSGDPDRRRPGVGPQMSDRLRPHSGGRRVRRSPRRTHFHGKPRRLRRMQAARRNAPFGCVTHHPGL